jgi:RimJ/RimL family protein N-acetyltransferase
MIETARLLLRPPSLGDRDAIVAGVGDLAVSRMLARVPHPYGPADAEAWLADMEPAFAAGTELPFLLVREGEVIGCVALHGVAAGAVGDFGYWLARPHWGRGYATEAARAVLAFAFDRLGAERVPSRVFAENAASWNVQRKLGFTVVAAGKGFSLARGAEVDDLETVLFRANFVRQP